MVVAAVSRVKVMSSIAAVTRLSSLKRRMSVTDIVSTAGLMADNIEKELGKLSSQRNSEIKIWIMVIMYIIMYM